MTAAVNYAVTKKFHIIVHPEVHPSLGPQLPQYCENAPVNKLVKSAYDAGVLWLNSAGNFREAFHLFRFSEENEVKETACKAKKGQTIQLCLNWGDCNFSCEDDDIYLIEIYDQKGNVQASTKNKALAHKAAKSGKYFIKIKALHFSKRYDHHVLMIFANIKLKPNSANMSSLASPANSKYAVTIGASHKNKPLSYSSEDTIYPGWSKPEFYAPSKLAHPRLGWPRILTKTSASVSYAAAFFAILLAD